MFRKQCKRRLKKNKIKCKTWEAQNTLHSFLLHSKPPAKEFEEVGLEGPMTINCET